jgi:hypothetical protein
MMLVAIEAEKRSRDLCGRPLHRRRRFAPSVMSIAAM